MTCQHDQQTLGFDQGTNPLALSRKILDNLLQLHRMTPIGDLSSSAALIARGRG